MSITLRVGRIFSFILILLSATIVAIMLIDTDTIAYKIMLGLALACVLLIALCHSNEMRMLRTIANGFDLLRAQDFSSRLAHVGQKESDRIVDLFNGMMTSLKHERLKLREQNHFLDLLIDVSPMGIILLDSNGKITECNRAAASFVGMDFTKRLLGITTAELGTNLGNILSSLKDREVRVVRLNDSMVYRCSRLSFMESGISHPFFLIEKLTEEVMKAERKSFEKVIRMMAHEINNSLAGIISVMDTAASEVDDKELIEAILASMQRSRDMSDFITKFASAVKIPQPSKVNSDLTNLLKSCKPLFDSICTAVGAKLIMDLPERAMPVFIDTVLIEQAITNIVKNAAESAGQGGEVIIDINETRKVLTITDNGAGISPEAGEMLFTPFFTTKESGHGLGLLLVSEVLNSHHCRFSLETGEDGLTRFQIKF